MKTIRAFVAPRNSGSADPRSQSDTPQVIETADRAGRMVAAAAREDIYHGRCLDKSLVLWWLLLWRHLPAEIHIGVRQTREKFEARAWVELFGSVINDTDALHQEYIPFGRDITKLGIQSH